MLSHGTFTVKARYGPVVTADSGYFGDDCLPNPELPFGGRMAACINDDAMERNYHDISRTNGIPPNCQGMPSVDSKYVYST